MRKRWILVLMLSACAVLLWRLLDRPESRISSVAFDAIQVGMSQSEVEQILGGPARDEYGQPVIVWVPRGDSLNSLRINPTGYAGGILFKEDSPTGASADQVFIAAEFPESDYQRVWLSESVLIAVLFDEDGRLIEKHISDVKVLDRPTALDWLRSRF